MIQENARRVLQNGVEIVVVCKDNSFDLSIDIFPDKVEFKKVQNNYFSYKFKLLNGKEKLEEPIHLEMKNRKYKKKGCSTQNFKRIFTVQEYYRFEISLKPILYVSEKMMKEDVERARRKRKNKGRAKAKELSRRLSTEGLKKPGLQTTHKSTYAKNNANHPFQGGRCSPK